MQKYRLILPQLRSNGRMLQKKCGSTTASGGKGYAEQSKSCHLREKL